MAKRKKNASTKKEKQVEEKHDEDEDSEVEEDEEVAPNDNFDDDDESIDDDEAFNSDDERKYGEFFDKHDDDDESGDSEDDGDSNEDDGSDDDEQEGDGGQYMLDLLDKLDAPEGSKGKQQTQARKDALENAAAANLVQESEFASVMKKGTLTLDALMEGLEDTQGFSSLQKTLKKVAQKEVTAVPLSKAVSKRVERKVNYDHQKEEVARWLDGVQQNRQAETLDFRPKERLNVTSEGLVEKFVPTTDFEKAVHAALQEAGQQDEEAILKAEEEAFMAQQGIDDLGGNDLTLEEFKKRRGELAKMRALMFYHEQKRHRINKIKSKKYRRIKKKQRERAKETEVEGEVMDNPDLLKELEEKEEYDRMQERMTLAHKNTSKWAKRILKRGKNVDVDTRKALSAQLKRGEDLRKKMNSLKDGFDSDESESEDLVESARKVLQETEDAENEDSERNGLFKLKFMQKGQERQRQQARDEAKELLRELEAHENLGDYDKAVRDDDSDDEKITKKKRVVASKEEMKQVLKEGELVVSSLKFGKSMAIMTSGEIDVDLGEETEKGEPETVTVSEHTTTMNVAIDDADKRISKATKKSPQEKESAKKSKRKEPQAAEDTAEDNPWITAASGPNGSNKKRRKSSALETGVVDVEGVLDVLGKGPKPSAEKKKSQTPASQNEDAKPEAKSITMLSQEELVRRAFASASEKEAEDDFAAEKAEVEEEENDAKTDKQKKKEKEMATVSGWGSWAGDGAPPPRPPKKLPKHLQAPLKKEPKRKREDAKRLNVIIREKRVKKTAENYMLDKVPYPFSTREEYERAMRGAVGKEWNVSKSFKDMTRPEIQTRAGKIIQPLSQQVKKQRDHRAPAKF